MSAAAPPVAAAGEPFCGLREAFLAGRDSPSDYLERRLARIDAHEPQLRAFVVIDRDGARAAARASSARWREGRPRSPIDGMPIGIKDIIETHDLPTQMGSPIYGGFQPRRDAACVSALRTAGAVLVGKTVTTEFAAGRAGPTRNPFDLARTPGGSSSGSAAAVAAAMLPAALGTQTMASIVRPSSYCGVFGWKPTHGTFSTDGVQPLSPTLDHLGVLARDPRDAWEVGQVLARALPGSPLEASADMPAARAPRRLCQLGTAGWQETAEPARRALRQALDTLARQGIEIVAFDDPRLRELDATVVEAARVAWSVFGWESQWPLRAYRERGEDQVGARLKELLQVAAGLTRADHARMLAWRDRLRERVAELAGPDAAFVSLASCGAASQGLDDTGSRACGAAWSLVGGPALSLPVLAVDGLPLGLQLMSAPHEDASAFAIARWITDALPTPYTLEP